MRDENQVKYLFSKYLYFYSMKMVNMHFSKDYDHAMAILTTQNKSLIIIIIY